MGHPPAFRALRLAAIDVTRLEPPASTWRPFNVRGRWQALTPRQLTAARLVATGLANSAIAKQMGITVHSVDNLLNVVYSELGLRDEPDLNARVATALLFLEHRGDDDAADAAERPAPHP